MKFHFSSVSGQSQIVSQSAELVLMNEVPFFLSQCSVTDHQPINTVSSDEPGSILPWSVLVPDCQPINSVSSDKQGSVLPQSVVSPRSSANQQS